MHASNDVTIVIPVRDRPQQLQRLLVSLEGHHCVVVDDGSADRRCCDVAEAAGAEVVMLADNQGPAAARNAGLARVTTSLVAFLDSDCLPQKGWLEPLLDAFDDALVAAVAPRIVPAPTSSPSALARYETIRSSLDRGPDAGLVRPQSAIPYVPSATLVVRRAVAGDHLFDPRLRSGEDVDLVWRLGQAGWDVRYVPASLVEHDGPTSLGEFLAKRASYGGSAGPLAQRHPDVMAPLHASAWSVAAWLLAVAKRPVAALGVVAASTLVLTYRLRRLVQDPVVVAGRIAGGGTARSALPALAGLTRAWSPAMLIGLAFRRTRWRAAAALLGPALADWSHHRDTLDPLTYAAFHVADDLAYGCGVWAGSIAAGTGRALWPSISWRARVWSSPALRRQLAPELP
jgi:mycofactocin system glycosyltransferase